MTPRERIAAALAYQRPDRLPLRVSPGAGGLYEHGQKLVDLLLTCGHDFGDLAGLTVPQPPEGTLAEDGSYHELKTDAWGTTWEYLIFGVWGHPTEWPLNDWSKLPRYVMPEPPHPTPDELARQRAALAARQERYFCLGHGGSLFEKLHSLRRFEDVLMDLALDSPELGTLGDRLVEHCSGLVDYALALGVDGVMFGDDFGTSTALLLSPATWQRYFRPRYDTLFGPLRQGGKPIFFHSCGAIQPLLPSLRELGVNVVWPQLTAFDLPELARICRDLGLAIELHPDRGGLMQTAPPDQVRRYVHELTETFRCDEGGSWLYLEIDPGFAWPNVQALVETAMELRA